MGTTLTGKIDYDDRQFAVYARGRAMSPVRVAAWRKVFSAHAPEHRPLAVLDLGSGTGRLTAPLAREFGGPVYGVEPSHRMRDIAARSAVHPAVTYLQGSAEQIPLPDDSCDLVLMFLIFHHVQDKVSAATEVARVLRPGGRVLIRSSFADRLPEKWWHRYFPRATDIEKEMFPSLSDVAEAFSGTRLQVLSLETVRECFANSLAESAARLHLRAISTFEHLTEEETEQGFAALDKAVAAETTPHPVEAISDLLVLG